MEHQPSDSLHYLREAIRAYQKRLDWETDTTLHDYMAGRLIELENQLKRLTAGAIKRRPVSHIPKAASATKGGRQVDL